MELKELLSNTIIVNSMTASINTQLDRKDFESLKCFFEKIDGKWNTRKNVFVFQREPKEVIAKFIKDGVAPKKNSNAFFPTPTKIIDEMLEKIMIDVSDDYVFNNLTLLEPSAGTGAIVDRIKNKFLSKNIDIVEYDDYNAQILRDKGYENVTEMDFLQYNTNLDKKYDFIITNPPYLGNAYIKHIKHSYSMLATNGMLVAVIPTSFLKNNDKLSLSFFDLVAKNNISLDFINNGFENTSVQTTIIVLRKREVGSLNVPNGFTNNESYSFCLSFMNEADNYKKIEKALETSETKQIKQEIKNCVDTYLSTCKKNIAKDYHISLYPFELKDIYIKDLMSYYAEEIQEEANIEQEKEIVAKVKSVKKITNKKVSTVKISKKQSSIFDFLEDVA